MDIELCISTHTLGDSNRDADNERYAAAVLAALQEEYPNAEIDVQLSSLYSSTVIRVADLDVFERVQEICRYIWDNEKY